MKMKNQKGITLMILVVTVISMVIIFGTISYNSISSYRLNAYYMMCSDIELLDEKIAIYYLEKKELPVTDEIIDITNLVGEDYGEANVNYNPNNSGTLHRIDLSKLDNLSLQGQDYFIDEQSHTIYSQSGKKIGDAIYHTSPTNYETVDLNLYQSLSF